ncbi:AhpC/TSA antioxidant enzyme-domain-containing protein [Crucibulum laeve]|uniref:AhpC/TSA antioxidant enzyme-domain-containing protein n=1 Tax=Crucibulum laeve TaxID=68775 RepID=A0A5C3LI92_9AGAR|nr:AhpC/TSA antioxidant enzyme-domain-containing protein [Crucibulum laeve]
MSETTSISNALPNEESISNAADLNVFDGKGDKLKFGSIFERQKTVVVFIRHFFCGSCKMYVEQLATIPKSALEDAGTRIVVIGCGEWNPIASYAESTGFSGEIYADPSLSVHHALGMNIQNLAATPAGQKKRSYLTSGAVSNVVKSIWTGPIKNPSHIGKQGNISQLGGDFILGPGNQCKFSSRMQHTQDHVEVTDLMKAAGVTVPQS